MNRLMQRIYSAMTNGENPVLDQVQNDIQLAKEFGEIDRSQYNMKSRDDGSILIHDKVHNEDTRAIDSEHGINLTEVPKNNLAVGDSVTWRDGERNRSGKLISVGDDTSHVDCDGKILSINTRSLSKMESENKEYSKSRARHFLVDPKGNLMATGWESSLGKLLKDHPDWKMVDQYNIDGYVADFQKRFSNLDPENQKLFTKPYRRYVILDDKGKFRFMVDITNAKGLLAQNPGWTMVREVEYNQSLQKRFSNFSKENQEFLNERGS